MQDLVRSGVGHLKDREEQWNSLNAGYVEEEKCSVKALLSSGDREVL